MALFYSFTDYTIIESLNWIGLKNFTRIFQDEFFFISLKNTIVYTLLYVPLGLVVSLAAAMLLNRKMKTTSLFRTFLFASLMFIGGYSNHLVLALKSTVWFAQSVA